MNNTDKAFCRRLCHPVPQMSDMARIFCVRCHSFVLTLHHTASHCITLQHTATRCNTLQHTPTRTATQGQSYGVLPPGIDPKKNKPYGVRLYSIASTRYGDIYTATHCNTLQHTATHCNTLYHTASHCITLHHTATHCNTLQHTALVMVMCIRQAAHYNTLHTATHCNTLQHTTTHFITPHTTTHYILQHTATHYITLQHTAPQCTRYGDVYSTVNTLQHTASHCNTLQHSTSYCNTLQTTANHCNTLHSLW